MLLRQPWRQAAAPLCHQVRCGKRNCWAAVKALTEGERLHQRSIGGPGFFSTPQNTPPRGTACTNFRSFQRRSILDGHTSFVVGGLNSGNCGCGLSYGGPSTGAVSETADSRLRPRPRLSRVVATFLLTPRKFLRYS